MYKLVTNDSLVHNIMALPYEGRLEVRGIDTSVLCIPFGEEYDTIKKVKEVVTDPVKMAEIHVYENDQLISEYKDYYNLEQICTSKYKVNGKEVDVLMAKMSRVSTIPEQINELIASVKKLSEDKEELEKNYAKFKESSENTVNKIEETVKETNEDIKNFLTEKGEAIDKIQKNNKNFETQIENFKKTQEDITESLNTTKNKIKTLSEDVSEFSETVGSNFEKLLEKDGQRAEAILAVEDSVNKLHVELNGMNEEDMDLDQLKEHRISLSKSNLRDYLSVATVSSNVHGGAYADYSITEEKQTQLMAMIMMASMNSEYQPSWNAKGEPCSYDWTVDELKYLAGQIEAVVRPLVSKQQHMETDIKNATTIDEVKNIDITF